MGTYLLRDIEGMREGVRKRKEERYCPNIYLWPPLVTTTQLIGPQICTLVQCTTVYNTNVTKITRLKRNGRY